MFKVQSSRIGAVDTAITVPLDGKNETGANLSAGSNGRQQSNHQISIDQTDSTVGTLTVTAISVGKSIAEPVFEDDGTTALVIDLSVANEPLTRSIENNALESIIVTGAGMDGSNDWRVTISSGD